MRASLIPRRAALSLRHGAGLAALCLAALGIPLTMAQGAGGAFSEYQVKAAFLYNFAKFVEWPSNGDAKPVKIGILGDDPFGDYLDDAIRGKTIRGRPIEARRFRSIGDLQVCDILFISGSEAKRVREIFKALSGVPVLTVGEGRDFAEEGGMIGLIIEAGKVRFDINNKAAKASGITVRSQLLQLARSVKK